MRQLAMLLACAFLFLLVMPKGLSRALPSNTETAVPPPTQDLANGLITTLVKNIQPGAAPMTLSMVVATPKPRVVKVVISEDGTDWFSVGNSTHKAVRYAVKIEFKGVPGLVAPLVGKEPPDTHIWVLHGEAPAYLKSEGPLRAGCPVWRIELVSPAWKDK